MSDERFLELVPLAALGALDGEERAAFEAAMASSPVLQRELAAYKETAGRRLNWKTRFAREGKDV